MKSTVLLTSLMVTGLLAASSAFAGTWSDNPDLQSGILNDLSKSGYVGTGLAMGRVRIDPFGGVHSGDSDIDQSGFVKGAAGPEKGEGDLYGNVLYNVDALR